MHIWVDAWAPVPKILQIGETDLQGAQIHLGILLLQKGHLGLQIADGIHGPGTVLQVQANLGQALHLLRQVLVHIVPVLFIVLEKIIKLRLIVHNKAVIAQHRQTLGQKLNSGGRSLDRQFKPLHKCLQRE